MPIQSNLNDSLDELSRTSSSSSYARVKSRAKTSGRKNANKESAASLLNSILDDSNKAAEEEKKKQEDARRRAEEEEALKKEEEELRMRIEGERELQKEKQAQEELRKNQSQMAMKVQREKDIEAGLIDVEAEEREKREAEEKARREEEEKARKAREKKERRELLARQKAELEEIQHKEEIEAAKPKPNHTPQIVLAAAVLVIAVGALLGWQLTREEIDIYALSNKYITSPVYFTDDSQEMYDMGVAIVAQEEPKAPPKPSSNKNRPSSKTPQQPQQQNRATLTSRKPGGLGTGKLGGGLGGKRGL